jgi:hypothetical protein
MPRRVFDVSPDGDRWKVSDRTGQTASKLFDQKSEAVQFGRTAAQSAEPSQLVIRKNDGQIETEYTYGSDPYPPRG